MGKRFFDFSIALISLSLLFPFACVAFILIKVSSSSPALSREKKVGKGFRPFYIYQLSPQRSVPSSPDASPGTVDFLERRVQEECFLGLRINKLAQLLNVLKGEMSLVGPKPEWPSYVEQFKPEYETILKVAPGMADLSSIELSDEPNRSAKIDPLGNRKNRPTLPKKIKLAQAYVQDRSFTLDLKILFTTFISRFLSSPFPYRGLRSGEKKRIKEVIFESRTQIIFLSHLLAIVLCNYVAFLLRFDGKIPPASYELFLKTISFVLAIRLGSLYLFGLNNGLWRYAGIRDMLNLSAAVLFSSIVIWILSSFVPQSGYPQSINLIDSSLLIVALAALRSAKRIYSILTRTTVGTRKVLIIGAGNAGEMIVRDMKQDRCYDSQPVAFIDDDPKKRFKKIHNIPVIGNTQEMETVVKKIHPDEILIAIPSATSAEIKNIINCCKPLNCPIKTLPNIAAVFGRTVSVNDIRSLDIEDLVGRPEIRIHDPAVGNKIRGKRVLVTGAGGSIGSELCRQVAAFQPEQLILFERNENNLYRVELDLQEKYSRVSIKSILADIVDTAKVNQVFLDYQPHIVFHAAAYKHVPMMEKNPFEAVRNNIMGTYRVLTASDRYGVEEFVLISTDKAVSPTSIMGASKRIAEMMVRSFDSESRTKLVSVRFGNVLESSGSIVPLFREQIKNRKPVKVTHPEVKRYFISLQEAVQLVLEASVLGDGGEVFVLDMGKPIKIIDLARTMIILSGFTPEEEIPIQLIGLRPGEKLHEGLFEDHEEVVQTRHEKIRLARNGRVDIDLLSYIERFAEMDTRTGHEEIVSVLKELIPTYQREVSPLTAPPSPEKVESEV